MNSRSKFGAYKTGLSISFPFSSRNAFSHSVVHLISPFFALPFNASVNGAAVPRTDLYILYLRKLRYRLDTGQRNPSSPLSNSAMSLLKKYGAFFNPKLILRGRYVPKLVQKAAYRCAVLLKGICQYPLDKSRDVINLAADTFFYAFFDIRKRKIFRSNDPV
ncbi:hypothetical protein TNCV_3729251 [Trichonephila clavipes]|nr:hypothetical protein TNCV_3729251 [Trichonephila clavipes]